MTSLLEKAPIISHFKMFLSKWWRRTAILVLIIIMLLRPSLPGGGMSKQSLTQIDVYFLVDLSPSVAAEDYNGSRTRLEGIKSDVEALVVQHAGARFSLIGFDTKTHILSPLTTDASALISATKTMLPAVVTYSAGSSIDAGLEFMQAKLESVRKLRPERKAILYYFGDGEQTVTRAPESFSPPADSVHGGPVLGYGTASGGKMLEHPGSFDDPDAKREYIHQYDDN